jgi:hypothetical protein
MEVSQQFRRIGAFRLGAEADAARLHGRGIESFDPNADPLVFKKV